MLRLRSWKWLLIFQLVLLEREFVCSRMFPSIHMLDCYCSIHHIRRPGAILHPGTLVATLELDDSSQVQAAKKSTDTLPQHKITTGCGEKVHQVGLGVDVLFQLELWSLANCLWVSPACIWSITKAYILKLEQSCIIIMVWCLLSTRCTSPQRWVLCTWWQGLESNKSLTTRTRWPL